MNPSLVIIDTSAWVFALERMYSAPEITKRVALLLGDNRAAIIPVISLELLGGARTGEEFDRLKRRLGGLHQLPLAGMHWQAAARMAFDLRRKGITVPYLDILIAASALESGATVMHADHHFDVISTNTGLPVESLVHLIPK